MVLNLSGIDLSADKALDITKKIKTLNIKLSLQNKSIYHTLLLTIQNNQFKLLYNKKYWHCIEKILKWYRNGEVRKLKPILFNHRMGFIQWDIISLIIYIEKL